MRLLLLAALLLAALTGCGYRTSTEFERSPTAPTGSVRTPIEEILITDGDVTDRDYAVVGDITVTISKVTYVDRDPTHDMIDMELVDVAHRVRADAVIFVRYGTVGQSFTSSGTLEGKGRAIKFVD